MTPGGRGLGPSRPHISFQGGEIQKSPGETRPSDHKLQTATTYDPVAKINFGLRVGAGDSASSSSSKPSSLVEYVRKE